MDVVKMKDPEAIYVGSRGLGLIRRTILGSVSNYIVNHSKIPVIVFPKNWRSSTQLK